MGGDCRGMHLCTWTRYPNMRLQDIKIYLGAFLMLYLVFYTEATVSKSCDKNCFSGKCINGTCVCDQGWVGAQCQHCQGRFKLTEPSGSLTDGPINYKYKTKCTWLIEGYPNAVLRLRFNHFATECSWDHVYVYDGDSIYAPLVAVFSGLVVPETRGNETVPEVVATSGYALLHFFSDAAYNLTGFHISYSVNSCPNNCSSHGKCSTGNSIASRVYCECEKYWKGEACDIPYCRNNCGSPDQGYCDLTGEKSCVCNDSWQGLAMVISCQSCHNVVVWYPHSLGRASHRAVVHGKLMWVIGGYSFNYSSFHMVLNYNLESRQSWIETPLILCVFIQPQSLTLCHLMPPQDDIYMYGGKLEAGSGNVTDELWVFNIPSRTWSLKNPSSLVQGQPYAVEGHSAHLAELTNGDVVMVVLFGYSPVYSYISKVQEYNIRTNSWQVPETNGAIVQGGYGHSSVYDSSSRCVYVHGGYKALPANKYGLVDELYRYEVQTQTWMILRESGLARYLHTAVLSSGTLLVFGGNTHNDTSLSNGAKCFSADFLAYDMACDEWKVLPRPDLHRDVNRFGHTSVVSNGSMYVFGGFSGVLLNDVLVYTPPSCKAFSEEQRCANAGPGIRCVWLRDHCVPWDTSHANGSLAVPFCPPRTNSAAERCYRFSDCVSCTANTNGCQWCEDKKCISASNNCTVVSLPTGGGSETAQSQLKQNEQICSKLVNCKSCSLNLNCQWELQQQECHAIPAQLCGEGWHHVGEACLRINSSRESYDNAQHYCKNLDGNIASLTTPKQVDFILDELQKYQLQEKIAPWVGLRKINISYWGWEDMSPFTNSSLQWLTGEPSDSGFCAYLERAEVAGLKANPCTATTDGLICEKPSARPCKTPCSLRTTCANCTSQAMECMWCSSTQRCVDSNAYVISFPYGQCLEWQTGDCASQNCSGLRTCGQCLDQAECGWCGDPTNTGKGQCMEGSYRGPMKSPSRQPRDRERDRDMVLELGLCPRDKGFDWAYIHCPACQCNGHSTCVNGSACEQCRNLTTGPQCQTCMPGYHGDPTNGGKCQACKCNGHANLCQVSTGKCYCQTKGIKGDQYNLLIDYQFTFSLLQEDDHHYTAINFMATPEQVSHILPLTSYTMTHLSPPAGTISGEEVPIVSKTNIQEHRDSFSCEKFNFRVNSNITFYVYVSNFSWPIKIQIAFSQHNSIMDLVQFFVTFFSCFLSLLLVAAVVWKVKQTCWASRRREQLMRERQQMASRPFASIAVALDVGVDQEQEELLQGLVEGVPKPIAVEPCWGSRAGVLTVLMCLPRVPSGIPPPGQSVSFRKYFLLLSLCLYLCLSLSPCLLASTLSPHLHLAQTAAD
uniref:Attractin like 1 n=1 Tax=Salmo trutta TaxID=8032 RepID=A0A673ZDZ3_SALTR